MHELVDLFQRQIRFVLRQRDERAFVVVRRLVAFMKQESRLALVCDDIRAEFRRALAEFAHADAELVAALRAHWDEQGACVSQAWEAKCNAEPDAIWAEIASPERLMQQLRKIADYSPSDFLERFADDSVAGPALSTLEHIRQCVLDRKGTEVAEVVAFFQIVSRFRESHQRALWTFWGAYGSYAGPALLRVENLAAALIPTPFPHEGTAEEQGDWGTPAIMGLRIRDVVLGKGLNRDEAQKVSDALKQMKRDLKAIAEEVVHRLGVHGSREGLVRRFKARCERFDAARLRKLAMRKRGAEEALTLTAAEFLFDSGFNPLFNAAIVNLRPDLFAPSAGHDFYIEAKQYDSARDLGASGKKVIKAIWQIWDTWNELDGSHDVREAFLLVFRRGGPLLVFDDDVVKYRGRTLYPVLIDISPPSVRGSRATLAPLHLAASDMRPEN